MINYQLVGYDGNSIIKYLDPAPEWLLNSLNKLQEILNLENNWDSHGAKQVSVYIAYAAFCLLEHLENDTPQPEISSTFYGGIKIEWHIGGADLKVEVDPDDNLSVSFDYCAKSDWDNRDEFVLLVNRFLSSARCMW